MDLGKAKYRVAALALLAMLVGCSTSKFDDPELNGYPVMVAEAGQPRLWVLTKQEEVRTVGVGSSGRGRTLRWRDDTYYHFDLQAFDPATARPLWSRRVLTLGNVQAVGPGPYRVVGSSAEGRLLGQDGDVVWLVVDERPMALRVSDGGLLADAAALEQRNPDLKGLLPTDGRHYGFDRGLVLLAADARRLMIRGPALKAEDYVPTPAPPAPPVELKSNGSPRIVPLKPLGEVPARIGKFNGQWLALYSAKEAADAASDDWGDNLRYPWQVIDEGALVRREFWRPRIASAQRFDEVFDRIEAMEPIPGAPSFLKGRFFKDLATGQPRVMTSPGGLMVWHSTRIDSAGRLALTRLDDGLAQVWSTELPLSENSTSTPVQYWQLPESVVVMGTRESTVDGVRLQEPHLVAVRLADGHRQAWNIKRAAAAP